MGLSNKLVGSNDNGINVNVNDSYDDNGNDNVGLAPRLAPELLSPFFVQYYGSFDVRPRFFNRTPLFCGQRPRQERSGVYLQGGRLFYNREPGSAKARPSPLLALSQNGGDFLWWQSVSLSMKLSLALLEYRASLHP